MRKAYKRILSLLLLMLICVPVVPTAAAERGQDPRQAEGDLRLSVAEHILGETSQGPVLDLRMEPGEAQKLQLSLTHQGERALIIQADTLPLGNSQSPQIVFDQQRLFIAPGETKELLLTVELPCSASQGVLTSQISFASETEIPLGVSDPVALGASRRRQSVNDRTDAIQNKDQLLTLRIRVQAPRLFNLTLQAVPSFHFGSGHTVPVVSTDYPVTQISGRITVKDHRLISGGWRLTARLGGFHNAGYPSVPMLTGTKLQLPAPHLKFEGVAIAHPTAYSTTHITNDSNSHTVIRAALNATLGTWHGDFDVSGVRLQVAPGRAYTGTNVGSITWTLYDAP